MRLRTWASLLLAAGFLVLQLDARQSSAVVDVKDEMPASLRSDFNDAINPPCLPVGSSLRDAERTTVRRLALTIPQVRKWQTNLLSAGLSPYSISDEFKGTFRATVLVHYDEGTSCEYRAKVRLSGDRKDHLGPEGASTIPSIDVELEEGNIDGIVRFKLLRQETRGGEAEIFVTEVFRRLGILAPRTKVVPVSLNGQTLTMLFQEKIEKELLESQGQRESIIVEKDESYHWAQVAAGQMDNGWAEPLWNFPRISNSKWATRGAAHRAVAWEGFRRVSRVYAETWSGEPWSAMLDSLLANDSPEAMNALAQHRILSVVMHVTHGLKVNNRRFYYEPMSGGFFPIYYDGNARIDKLKSLPEEFPSSEEQIRLRGITDEDLSQTRAALAEINVAELYIALENSGSTLTLTDVSNTLKLMDEKVKLLGPFLTQAPVPLWSPSPHAGEPDTYDLVFGWDQKSMQSCTLDTWTCQSLPLTDDEATRLLAGRLELGDKVYKYAGPSLHAYELGTDPYPQALGPSASHLIGDTSVFAFGDIEVGVDMENRVLTADLEEESARLVLRGGRLKSWTLKITGPSSDKDASGERIDERLLTGCLTLVDLEIEAISIFARGGLCEDTINLVRTSGNIESLFVSDAFQDAVDLDFSSLVVESSVVVGAGNDCMDVSAGDYVLHELIASSCGDKGLSVGEGASVLLTTGVVNDSQFALVVKDSSTLQVDSARVTGSAVCVMAYRKKQEFGGAMVSLQDVECSANTFVAQTGSEIRTK